MMRAKVAAVYGQGVTSSPKFMPLNIDTKEIAADFESPAVMSAVWGTGAAGKDRPMDCGMTKYNGIAIGAVTSTGDSATVPVVLYQDANAGTTPVTVNLDPATGVIKGVACGGAAQTPLPGIAPIAAYYGAVVNLDQSVLNDKTKSFFTPAFTAWRPASSDHEIRSCNQGGSDRWAVALTGTTASTSTWDFEAGLVTTVADPAGSVEQTGFHNGVAVDLATDKISRVSCYMKPPTVDKAHPDQYAANLLEYYRLAADQTSLGVDAKAAIRPYFVSGAAFTAAWGSTGTVPLLCTTKVPGTVEEPDGTKPTTTGSQLTLSMVTWPDWHPGHPGQEISKFTLVFDTSAMKISSITCKK